MIELNRQSRGFGSDNHSGIHPELLNAIAEANFAHAPSYGTDQWTEKAQDSFKTHFGPKAETHFVFNGTAANVLALKASVESYHSVLVSDMSHMNVDECGAPEFIAGCKLIALPSKNGKLQLADLEKTLIRRGDQHYSQVRMVSLTQPTELGTCYTLQEIKDITAWAHANHLFVHIDGARLPNAAVSLNCSFKEMTTDCGIDVISFGGTKNGFLFGEAVVILNSEINKDFKYIRKQALQLPSKTRFISAQFVKTLTNDLWKEIATHSCQMAQSLYKGLQQFPEIEFDAKPESNAVFVRMPKEWIKILKQKFFFYVWDENTWSCRLMTSWDTQEVDIQGFIGEIKKIKGLL